MNQVHGCDTCMGLLQETTTRHDVFSWAIRWTCPTCSKDFHCCDHTCGTRSSTTFVSRRQLSRHHRQKHKIPRLANTVSDQYDDIPSWDPPEAESNPHSIPIKAYVMFSVSPPTERFFEHLQQYSFRTAVTGMVARACFQDASISNALNNNVCVYDLALFFRIARLVFQTGPKQQHLLAGVLSGFERRFLPLGDRCRSVPVGDGGLPVPTTQKAFLATLLNPSNQNSLNSIIPRPPTLTLRGGHAYVSIMALLSYELGFAQPNVDPPYNPKYERLVNSLHGQELFCRAKSQLMHDASHIADTVAGYVSYVVLFLMWFDGWDPNASSKGNRSPVWSGTLTMVFLNLEGAVVSVATYPFAAGPGKADHEVIFENILADLRKTQAPLQSNHPSCRWYYSRAAARMALVYGELFCIWQDQPARRQETNLLGGNSNNHAIFGTACHVKQLCVPIAACVACQQATTLYLQRGNFQDALRPPCLLCRNWNFPTDPESSLYQHAISHKFPTDAVVGKEFNRGGGTIGTPLLIAAWREACAAVVSGRWTDSTVHIYLKTFCINEATIKAMLHQCRNYVLWTELGLDPESYAPQTLAYYRQQYAESPHRFVIPEPPAAWSLAPLALHVETIMHLAGGVQKAVAKFVHRYATSLGNGPALTARLAFPIALLHKYCRVQYLPLAAYNTDRFGGWVMENYKSLCKLAPWLYRCFEEDALQPPPPFVTPINERSKWTQKQNIGYLRSRSIPTVANMKAADARRAVDELYRQPGGPPSPVVHSASAVLPKDMRRLWLSCSTMFKDLMRVEHDTFSINRTNARVRAFLSEIEALDHLLQPSRSKPLYLAKYNFPSLLRAATHLAQFGNIRDLHEGGIEGEAMVKQLRPLVPKGLKNKFATHLLRKAFRDYTLDRLLCNLVPESIVPNTTNHLSVTEEEIDAFNQEDAAEGDDTNDAPDPYLHIRHMLEEPMDQAETDADLAPSSLLFRRYSSRAVVEHYLALGVPISAVITDQGGKQRIGVIVSKCNQWWLLPLQIEEMQFDDALGFTYFQIQLHSSKEKMLVRTKPNGETPTFHIHLLNYATLLPALWLEGPVPYALLTMEGEHLDAAANFV